MVAKTEQAFLNVKDAAAYCGLSVRSIRNLILAKKLTGYRPMKRRIVIKREELDNYIRTSPTS